MTVKGKIFKRRRYNFIKKIFTVSSRSKNQIARDLRERDIADQLDVSLKNS